jgi:two-component system cell cycle response regulator DivK
MGKIKVMLFDDDQMILDLCESILIRKGYDIYTSLTCENIVEQVRAKMPDLILMDNWIPQFGGIHATKILKKEPDLIHIPIIFFTSDTNIRNLAQSAGADSFLSKPFSIRDLEGKIVSLLDKK